MSDLEWLRRKADEARCTEAERLRRARERARASGKEPFDFDALCRRYDPSSELASSSELPDRAATAAALERRYYLDHPEVKTIAEFAEVLHRLRPFR